MDLLRARFTDDTPRPAGPPAAGWTARLARLATFQVRLFMLLLCVSASLLFVVGYYVFERMHATLYENLGQHAVVQAQQIAAIPEMVAAVRTRDLPVVERIAKTMLQRTDASFIVIGDAQGRRLYHPKLPPGTPMVGDDNTPVLHDGLSEVTVRTGSLGYALRGKAPIKDADGTVIGVVSVGYLQDVIFDRDVAQRGPVVVFLTFALGATFLSAWFFARSIKRQMLGMEPAEISRLVRQQEAVFDSIMEGVIAVDRHDRVRAINHAARDIVGDTRPSHEIIGCLLADVVGSGAPSCGEGGDSAPEIRDAVLLFNNVQVIANRLPVIVAGKPVGAVLSFRRKDDIATLSLQLSQVRRHAENLRVVRHEHMNWLSTISGLLEMKHYDEALQLARMQSRTQQRVLDTISQAFFNAPVCGMLLGKYYRARELGLELVFDPGCRLTSLPETLKVSEWLSIIGNLLDNAFDAALALGERGQRVAFLMIESDDEIVIEVADTGVGVDASVRETLFDLGVSSKPGGEHGIGLHLVKTYVEQAGGTIIIEENEPRGTIFSLFIPKGAARAAEA
ncbi:ATP-binding protein [Rubrivivax gelatinosus]|uniref:histidine kinase n=1 Tax=Rubrivivax gelatinosus (strain NBRC 100245 / IL144) TaxID=983917 RepID=I0HRM3_RUBGI|nr:sensor histidine kinase [Rubrivivax gelatinosus]MBG6082191.1 two-component system cit operon sensor histidine kinase CitA [Rubrivivax gelatinosus]BAL95660.1 sensor kinase CitA [Rubrivivax gelatinosus IL144]